MIIENKYLKISVGQAGRCLAAVCVDDKINGRHYDLGSQIFSLDVLESKTDEACSKKEFSDDVYRIKGNELHCISLECCDIAAQPEARQLLARRPAQRITARFAVSTIGYAFTWWVELREDVSYARLGITLCPGQSTMPVRCVTLLDVAAPEARVDGTVKGAPVVAAGNRLFAGVEHPMSAATAHAGGFTCTLPRTTDYPQRELSEISAVFGCCDPSQLRRCFQLSYLNELRPRPYAPYLNYNTWYDIGYFTRYDEKTALETVRLLGEEMVTKRGAVLDSFLFDDGWDDLTTMWEFHEGMPNEFRELTKLCESYGAGSGTWISPWGGYGQPKLDRIAACAGEYETNERGFALTGPKYYERFRELCMHLILENGISHFKLDGTSGEAPPVPGSRFGSDLDAMMSIIEEMRAAREDVFINLTTGTWASPFWFTTADSVWRGDWDHDFCGEGTLRNQWMTYRDNVIFEHNVQRCPLFPITSLMTHGVIYNQGARGLTVTEGDDFAKEAWSGFGLGTQMLEIYITPSMLSADEWDSLAAAAKWARSHADILVDSHWIGGKPAALEIYGWASWGGTKGVITLRNPAGREQTISLDPAAIFELPLGAPTRYRISSPKGDILPAQEMQATCPLSFTLKPFELLVIDAEAILP